MGRLRTGDSGRLADVPSHRQPGIGQTSDRKRIGKTHALLTASGAEIKHPQIAAVRRWNSVVASRAASASTDGEAFGVRLPSQHPLHSHGAMPWTPVGPALAGVGRPEHRGENDRLGVYEIDPLGRRKVDATGVRRRGRQAGNCCRCDEEKQPHGSQLSVPLNVRNRSSAADPLTGRFFLNGPRAVMIESACCAPS